MDEFRDSLSNKKRCLGPMFTFSKRWKHGKKVFCLELKSLSSEMEKFSKLPNKIRNSFPIR